MKVGDRFHGMTVDSVSKDGKSFTAIGICINGTSLRYHIHEVDDFAKRKHFLTFTGEDRTETKGKFFEAWIE